MYVVANGDAAAAAPVVCPPALSCYYSSGLCVSGE